MVALLLCFNRLIAITSVISILYINKHSTHTHIYINIHILNVRAIYYPYMSPHMSHMSLPHDDVIKWKHFPRYWPFVRGIHRSPVNFPHKGLWRGALMFSLICTWVNGWVNNRGAGDLRRHRAHYDVTVMLEWHTWHWSRIWHSIWSPMGNNCKSVQKGLKCVEMQ